MKVIRIIFVVAICISCTQKKESDTQPTHQLGTNNVTNTIDKSFDSIMADILIRYKYERYFFPYDSSIPLHEIYSLKQRVYLPEFHNITFDLRKLQQNSSDISSVVHIYNDSIQCILPFTDLQYYYWRSKEGNEGEYQEHMNFEPTVNKTILSLKLKESGEIEIFFDHLMSLFNADRIIGPMDFEAYKLKNSYFIKHASMRKSCAVDVKKTERFVQDNYKIKNSFLYSDGVVIYFFKLTETGHIETQILNYSCANYLVL